MLFVYAIAFVHAHHRTWISSRAPCYVTGSRWRTWFKRRRRRKSDKLDRFPIQQTSSSPSRRSREAEMILLSVSLSLSVSDTRDPAQVFENNDNKTHGDARRPGRPPWIANRNCGHKRGSRGAPLVYRPRNFARICHQRRRGVGGVMRINRTSVYVCDLTNANVLLLFSCKFVCSCSCSFLQATSSTIHLHFAL